jgi:hypothetical protein
MRATCCLDSVPQWRSNIAAGFGQPPRHGPSRVVAMQFMHFVSRPIVSDGTKERVAVSLDMLGAPALATRFPAAAGLRVLGVPSHANVYILLYNK